MHTLMHALRACVYKVSGDKERRRDIKGLKLTERVGTTGVESIIKGDTKMTSNDRRVVGEPGNGLVYGDEVAPLMHPLELSSKAIALIVEDVVIVDDLQAILSWFRAPRSQAKQPQRPSPRVCSKSLPWCAIRLKRLQGPDRPGRLNAIG